MKEKKNTYTLVPPPINHKGRVFLLFILTLILSSCKYWHEPVREYLEKWTKEVSIEKFEVEDVESYYDKDGNLCIPSGQDATLTLFLINPFHYDYTGEYRAKLPQCTTPGMTIWPDANDTTLLHLTYDRDFLVAHDGKPDGGSEIGTTINYEHPVNTTPKSYTFSLKCNSKPPAINDAAIMYRTVSGQDYYVLAFNCPDPTLCSSTEIHRDIVAVNINGESYSVQLDSSGNMNFFDSDIFARGMRDNLHVLNRDFNESERSVYFITTDPVINGVDKSFTISFVDSAGLDNLISLDTKVPSVAAPTVKDNDGVELSPDGVNTLHTDSGQTYSTLTIEPPTRDAAGNSLGDLKPAVKFELYNADDVYALDGQINSPTASGPDANGNVTLQIPNNGHYILRVHAEKEGYTKSATIEYRLNLEYPTLKAPVVNKSINGVLTLLSPTADNNYIELDGNNWIKVRFDAPTETTAGEHVDLNIDSDKATTIYYAIIQGKRIREDLNYETNSGGGFLKSYEGFGQYCLTVYATKPGYNESVHVTYLIKAHNDTLYVAGDGNDTTNDGSQDHPYATIQHAVSELTAYNNASKTYTINVSGQVNGLQTVSDDLNNKAAKLIITGVGDSDTLMGSGTGSVLSIMTSVPVEISSLGITGGRAVSGGGLYAGGYSDITLKGGVNIYGNSATNGGGVFVNSNASVTLAGAKIGGSSSNVNTSTANGGGVSIASGGTFTLTSGDVTYNSLSDSNKLGGGIYNSGTLTVNGGTISYNSITGDSSLGGGIFNGGTLTINNGTISNNSITGASAFGGGICNSGTLSISGGTISSNSITGSNSHGGGVFNQGTFTMSGGSITGNSAKNGAGVATEYSGNFALSGGTISGNTGATNGSGVFVFSSFTMSGSASVNANNDVYLNGKVINISDDLSATSCATITPNVWARGIQVLGGNVTEANCGKFSLTDTFFEVARESASSAKIDADFYVKNGGNNARATGKSDSPFGSIDTALIQEMWNPNRDYIINIIGEVKGTHSISGQLVNGKAKSIKIKGTDGNAKLNAESSSDDTSKTVLTISTTVPVLIEDLTITGGQALTGGGIKVNSNATLTLLNGAKVTGNKAVKVGDTGGFGGGVWLGSNAKLFMYGSCVIGDNGSHTHEALLDNYANYAAAGGGGIYNAGSVYMGYSSFDESNETGTKSNITDNGGVWYNYGHFGGGVYNVGDGKIYMASGFLAYNGTQNSGAGIYHASGTVVINGGTIKNNKASIFGGGICEQNTVNKLELNGGTIIDNQADSAGGAIYANKTFSIGTGISIPYDEGAIKPNNVYINATSSSSPCIYANAYRYTNLNQNNRIHIKGPRQLYDENYKILDGNIGASFGVIDPGSYNDHEWAVDSNGYMMIAD